MKPEACSDKTRVAAPQTQGRIDKSVTRQPLGKKTPQAALLWTLPCPRTPHPAKGSASEWRVPELSKEEVTASFLRMLQDKQNKHQLVSVGRTLACLEEGGARDSFLRLLPALHF